MQRQYALIAIYFGVLFFQSTFESEVFTFNALESSNT